MLGTKAIDRDGQQWSTRWLLELDTEDLTLPSEEQATSQIGRQEAEDFALAVLRRQRDRPVTS